MKYLGPVDEQQRTARLAADDDIASGWEVEELVGSAVGGVAGPSSRWIGLFVGVAVAVIGFGFIGHTGDPSGRTNPPSPSSVANPSAPISTDRPTPARAPLAIVLPVDGAVAPSPVITVHALASRPLGELHIAVMLGDAVLGWRTVEAATAGPVDVGIPVFAPTFEAPVTLVASAAPHDGASGYEVRRSLRLRIPLAAGIWMAGRGAGGAPNDVVVRGFAPLSAGSVQIELIDRVGHRLAASTVAAGMDPGQPGSLGGRMLELGSFNARFHCSARRVREPLTVRITWRDVTTGLALHLEQPVGAAPVVAHDVARRR